ncbi:Na+/H+ antiporter NhaC family protein [Paraferrimonas sedimenticola]|uniref:Tetracycline efflux Na+/H+ antiporter family transporter Tet(35) n=1 Tax=Paraferrimonas sedimenticola TaxID=375674 RepID=A0AA37VXE0_9GAMM|nr:Na+/H+ antiporter NhaC family protein [Paraferrimonas sedimenticola]GLP96686.1 tetracycline efflux Na+/H+ antiporter family transporter Tet(35) [Paraferrimonas sedimenticola]
MSLTSYADSALSLIPPLLAISMAVVTRKVLPSLGVGILAGILMLTQFDLGAAATHLAQTVSGLFVEDGGANWGNLYILLFLVILGATTALISASGSARAFADWARQRIRTKRDAKLLTMALGVVVFIDDYFNSLVVGSVSRPITDRYYVSRAKLAYILDSTAAPVCVISPVSSWGAYIIALIGGLLAARGYDGGGQLATFVQMIPMNFYAIFALILLFAVVWFGLDVGPMLRHEIKAQKGELYDPERGNPPGTNAELEEANNGSVAGLFGPIITLVVATASFMVASGAAELADAGQAFSILGAFENTNVGYSLFNGSVAGLAVTLVFAFKQRLEGQLIVQAVIAGARSMLPAAYILLFAWAIGGIIGEVETGKYLVSQLEGAIAPEYMPMVLFLLAGFTAFSTGTSWGTFGIMLPIAADMAMGTDTTLMLPMLSAVLAGAVFGDHCSPISDTTILSSTGAGCHHIDHVTTQLPYALMVAGISLVGYLVLGMTHSLITALLVCSVLVTLVIALLKFKQSRY